MKGKKRKAFLPERGIAWVVTFLLTLFLTMTLLSETAVRIMTSSGLHQAVTTNEENLDGQLLHIYEEIDLLAEEYGFSAEAVKATVSRDKLKEMNRETADWWYRLLAEGEMGAFPRWYSGEIEDTVYATMNEENAQGDTETIVAELTEMIELTVFPMRETLLTAGMDIVKAYADLPGIIRSVRKVPMLGLSMSFLAAGLIALLLGRDIVQSLKHYGTAAAGTGIAVFTTGIFLRGLRMTETISQASARLAGEYGLLMQKTGVRAGAVSLMLIGIGYLFLYLYRKKTGRDIEQAAEQAE